jgi:hypothetical protein
MRRYGKLQNAGGNVLNTLARINDDRPKHKSSFFQTNTHRDTER